MPRASMPLSRLMSSLTLGYGLFALVKPRHLGDALGASGKQAEVYDRLAHTFAGRDLAVSGIGVAAPSKELVTMAMGLRIAGDLSDAVNLGLQAATGSVRTKVLAVTLTWAALNAAALAIDLTGRA